MWFAPDINSLVLVAFADGNRKHGYIMFCNATNLIVPYSRKFCKFLTPSRKKQTPNRKDNDIQDQTHLDLAEVIKQGHK